MIETARLSIKKPEGEQIDFVAPLFANPNVMRHIGSGVTRNRDESLKAIQNNTKHWETFGFGFFNVFEKETGFFVGRAGLFHLAFQHDNPEVEMGFILNEQFWGKGYGTEIAKALFEWGAENLEVDHILAVTYKENTASRNVLEKIGMQFDHEGQYPNVVQKVLYFSVPI
ncbi:MAG: hypothetical protein K1000chlam2_01170 [Chlamydiae bacterium]|nr:hypothetical protein [Chlamydiota bacterium]